MYLRNTLAPALFRIILPKEMISAFGKPFALRLESEVNSEKPLKQALFDPYMGDSTLVFPSDNVISVHSESSLSTNRLRNRKRGHTGQLPRKSSNAEGVD